MKNSSNPQKTTFIISTFGQFDIQLNGKSLVAPHASSIKIWELFKFMLTHKDRVFTPEILSDQLWIEESYDDPRSTLRKQMHRLRQMLNHQESDPHKTIEFSNGYYRWNPLFPYQLDTEIFEKTIKRAEALKTADANEALKQFHLAISLYVGDYLPDCLEQHWVFPIRNYFRRLYLSAVVQTIELLIQRDGYDAIIPLCEKAIQIDIYEEAFHIHYMEALMHKGYQKQAISHYEHITSFYYREMGIKPSLALKTLYKEMMNFKMHRSTEDDVIESLEIEENVENAFFCEPDVFRSIYELERRRSARTGVSFSVGLITVIPMKGNNTTQTAMRVNNIKEHLMLSLRKGDIISLWSDVQLLVLLPGVDSDLMEQITQRIFQDIPNPENVIIKQLSTLTPTLLKDQAY